MKGRVGQLVLGGIISLLALGDGTLHLALNAILFGGARRRPTGTQGNTPPGPPPGAPRGPVRNPFILPLNQLFLLNFAGEVALVLVFWLTRRWLGARRWIVDVAMIVYAGATFVAWWIFGRPNPMGLGYLSKGIEIVLIIALIVDIWTIARQRMASSPASAQPKVTSAS